MPPKSPRSATLRATQPRLWRSVALSTAAVSLAAATPLIAGISTGPAYDASDARVWLAQATTAEAGEAGEAGAIANAAPDVAYLTRLFIVEGHLVAAANL